jgi:hypothetical protein
MKKLFGICPQCGSRIPINDAVRLGGGTVICGDCGSTISIQIPLRAPRPSDSEEIEIVNPDEGASEEVGDADSAVAFDDDLSTATDRGASANRPLTRRQTVKNRASGRRQNAAGANTFVPPTNLGSGGGRKSKNRQLRIVLAGAGMALITCVIVAGVLLVRAGSETPRFEAPEKYVPINAGSIPLTGVIPEGWKQHYGGGVGAVPIRASFSDGGSISIEVRQTVGISLMIVQVIAKKNPQPPSLSQLHDHHRKMIKPDFGRFEDGSAHPLETESFSEACVSTFTAKEPGIFGGEVKGCRATLRGRERQFSVVCKCKPDQFDDVLPVFEKIIASLGTRETKKR